jgi:hypothetical protein
MHTEMVRRYRARRVRAAAERMLYWAGLVVMIALAPVLLLVGEPAEPIVRRRVVPIRKALPPALSEPDRRASRRLRQLAGMLRGRSRHQLRRAG